MEKETIQKLMTEKFYKTRFYKVDHTTFGGIICVSDFNTDYRGKDNTNGSTIASRIAQDQRFDEQCRKNILIKQSNGGYTYVKRNDET